MKRRKILVLIPVLGLFLTGCSLSEVKSTVKNSWIGQHILNPIYQPLKKLINGDQPAEEEKPAEQQTPSGESTDPGTDPGTNPGTDPGTNPGTDPGTNPGTDPGTDPTPTGNDGTLEHPYTVAEARAIAAKLVVEENKSTTYAESAVYVTGVAKGNAKESTKTAGTYQFYMADTVDEKDDMNFYWGTLGENVVVPLAGYSVVVHGTLAHYKNDSGNSTYELAGNADKEIADPEVVSATAPAVSGISFKSESYDVYAGTDKDLSDQIVFAPVGASGEVSFSVTDNEKATISEAGVLTLANDAEGTATVKATCGDFDATCTINIQVGQAQPVDVEIAPSDGEAVDTKDFSIVKDGVTVEVKASTLTAEQIRVFKGKTITISSSKTITKIVFTCTANGAAKYGPGSFGAGAPSGYTFETEGPTGTWEGSGSSVQFTASDNQVRISSIVVTIQ